jgi:hypothetical protein
MCRISSSVGYLSLKFGKSLRLRFHLFFASASDGAAFFFFGIITTVGTVI